MKRHAYVLLVGVAVVTGLAAVVMGIVLGERLRDPDGFLGPSWFKLPMMLLGAFVVDVVPRSLWHSHRGDGTFGSNARKIIDEHWTRERIRLVVVGLVCFYVTYVGYRNLKNFLPLVFGETLHDTLLHRIDRALMFGHEPGVVLHTLLGDNYAAHVLAVVYLIFLPVSPITLVGYLVWSRNISWGYWYATAQSLTWALGALSYYALPTLGPNFAFPFIYHDLDRTGVTALLDALYYSRNDVKYSPLTTDSIQSVAGFASLHVGIILTLALIAHYTVRNVWVRRAVWVYFVLTVLSTLYFGWHYIADDVGGALIAVFSVWLAGRVTGQKFDRHGWSSHPTTLDAEVPVEHAPAALVRPGHRE